MHDRLVAEHVDCHCVRHCSLSGLTLAISMIEIICMGVQGGGGSSPVEPGNMLWLIQRDFLEGKTVQTMVSEALQPVPNPEQDQDIAQVDLARL